MNTRSSNNSSRGQCTSYRVVPGRLPLLFLLAICFFAFVQASPRASSGQDRPSNSPIEPQGELIPYFDETNSSQAPTMIPGTVIVESELSNAVSDALRQRIDLDQMTVEHYAITDVTALDKWHFVSVIGLAGVGDDLNWTLTQNGIWFGLVLMTKTEDQVWIAAVEGTPLYSKMLAQVPDALLNESAKQGLDPTNERNLVGTSNRFPWRDGYEMKYVINGIHSAGFVNPDMAGWLAVDFQSDGDISAGHAPNMLLAAAPGTVTYRCTPYAGQRSTAIKVDDLLYAHLIDSSDITLGDQYSQGDEIGPLLPGSFYERCGYANQYANEYHVHWGFPNTGSFAAAGWTLSFLDEAWRRDSEVKRPGSWFLAEGTTCPAPILVAPADGEVVTNQTVEFSWNSISGCTFTDYRLRVCSSTDISDPDNCLPEEGYVDMLVGDTSQTITINDRDEQDLYWGVQAAGAAVAEWSAVRRFRIEPNQEPPTETLTPTPSNTATETPTATLTYTPTHTPNPSPTPRCNNLLRDGGFEDQSGWIFPLTPYPASYSADVIHDGNWSARSGIVLTEDNVLSYSTLLQNVEIPEDVNDLTLRFWLFPQTSETTSLSLPTNPLGMMEKNALTASDAQMVLILDSYGQVIDRLLMMRSNAASWVPYEFDISRHAGQTIKVYFGTYNNGSYGITSMYVDDVTLSDCAQELATSTPTSTPMNTPTFTPTYTPSFTPTNTPTFTPTNTPTFTPTNIPTFTPTSTPNGEPKIHLFYGLVLLNDVPFGISGRVMDHLGQPLADAEVSTNKGQVTFTDENGFYNLNHLDRDTYVVTVEKEGYQFIPQDRQVVIPPSAGYQDFEGVPLTPTPDPYPAP